MRILQISSFYPPNVIGGAEICAFNLAEWQTRRGHEVGILTAAPTAADKSFGAAISDQTHYRIQTPHIYPVFQARTAPGWQKPIWHTQDVLDFRNPRRFARVIDDFRPDMVHIHWIQGMGYNSLKVLGERDIPTAITLHDLSLACIRTTMYRGIDECTGQCRPCKISSNFKLGYLRSISRLGFISPSRANLTKMQSLMPIADYPSFHILNANRYPAPMVGHGPADALRLLYVGRLEATKGVNVMMEAVEPLAESRNFTLTLLGSGPEEEALRARYGHLGWVNIEGQVPLQTVSDRMAQSDLLLTPSLWLENSPGVVFQALGVGLPVMASDRGGLPELVTPGVNGFLLPPGDVAAWRSAIGDVIDNPSTLAPLRHNIEKAASYYNEDSLAEQIMASYDRIAHPA